MDSISNRKRRVLIGIVAFDGMLAEAQKATMKAFYDLGKYHSKDFEFFFEIALKKEQFRAKNYLTQVALRFKCDFMWQIDDDTILNPNTFAALIHMLDENPEAGIAGTLYCQRGGERHPVVMWVDINPNGTLIADYYNPHELTGDVMEVGVTGGGCMMFRMEPFKEFMEPYFWNEADIGTDLQICFRMFQAGWKVLCHTGHEVGHVGTRKIWYPSTVEGPIADMWRFNEKVYYDLLAFLGINADEYQSLIVKSTVALNAKWFELAPETPHEIMGVYVNEDIQSLNVARNVFYNSKRRRDWGEFTTYVKEAKPKTGLDYGCGVGIASQIMAQNGVKTLAIDFDCQPVDFLEWRAERHGFKENLEIIRLGDPDGRKALPNQNFDVIVVKDVLEHLTNPEEVLVELLSRLNPKGVLVCNLHLVDFKTAAEGQPQHLDLLPDDKFLDICHEWGVYPWNGCLLKKEN